MTNYRFVGNHPDELDGGRPIEPGQLTGDIEVTDETPKLKQLIDDGLLVDSSESGSPTGPTNADAPAEDPSDSPVLRNLPQTPPPKPDISTNEGEEAEV